MIFDCRWQLYFDAGTLCPLFDTDAHSFDASPTACADYDFAILLAKIVSGRRGREMVLSIFVIDYLPLISCRNTARDGRSAGRHV